MDILIWLAVVVVFIVVEIFSLGLTSIWFSAGALLAMLSTFATDSFLSQFVIFAFSTIIFMILLKPLTEKFFLKEVVKTNFDRIIGETAVVTTDVTAESGEVKADGKTWTARSLQSDMSFKLGEVVTIKEIQGVKLIVDTKK